MCIVYGYNTASSMDQRISLLIKSLKLNHLFSPRIPIVMNEILLLQIVTVSAQLRYPLVYEALYLLAFFYFLRLSNILQHSVNSFDKSRHLGVGDLIFF